MRRKAPGFGPKGRGGFVMLLKIDQQQIIAKAEDGVLTTA